MLLADKDITTTTILGRFRQVDLRLKLTAVILQSLPLQIPIGVLKPQHLLIAFELARTQPRHLLQHPGLLI